DRRGDHVAGLEIGGGAVLAREEHPPLEWRRQQAPPLLDDRRRRLQGGPAGRPVAQGAASVLWAVDLPDDGPTGGFYRDGRPGPRRAPPAPQRPSSPPTP